MQQTYIFSWASAQVQACTFHGSARLVKSICAGAAGGLKALLISLLSICATEPLPTLLFLWQVLALMDFRPKLAHPLRTMDPLIFTRA